MASFKALVIYGDGLQAHYYEEKSETFNRVGDRVTPILIVPSLELMARYGLKKDDLTIETDDGRMGLWAEYQPEMIHWLSKSKSGAVILVYCAFDGSPTSIMDKHSELFMQLKNLRGMLDAERAGSSVLMSDYSSAMAVRGELLREEKEFRDLLAEKDDSEDD